MSRVARVLLAALVLGGCSVATRTIDESTSQGPIADDMWTKQVVAANGRMPTFEEKRHFEDVLGERISKYLREHEDAASNTLTVPAFRFLHQATVGMDKGQVEVLLGPAFTTSDDAQQMANWARRQWPHQPPLISSMTSWPQGTKVGMRLRTYPGRWLAE